MPYNYRTELGRYRKYYQSLEPLVQKITSKSYTAVIFSFLAVSLFGWYAIRPTIQTILYLRREIADKVEINKKMEDKISALIEAQAYYQEVEPLLPLVAQSLPPNSDALPLVIQLRNLASESGVLLTTVSVPTVPLTKDTTDPKTPAPKAGTTTLQQFDVTTTVSGPYANIKSFIDGLINMRRIVSFNGLSIIPAKSSKTASPSAEPGGLILQLSLNIRTYYVIE